jgi:hypothetical protein
MPTLLAVFVPRAAPRTVVNSCSIFPSDWMSLNNCCASFPQRYSFMKRILCFRETLPCARALGLSPALSTMQLAGKSRSVVFISIVCGLPCVTVRSAPAIVVSGPAQRLLTLWPARSQSRHATLSIESSHSFDASTAASIATGWSEPVPGRELHPLKSSVFHGALLRQLSQPKPRSPLIAARTQAK